MINMIQWFSKYIYTYINAITIILGRLRQNLPHQINLSKPWVSPWYKKWIKTSHWEHNTTECSKPEVITIQTSSHIAALQMLLGFQFNE